MSPRALMTIGALIGSTVGSYLPVLWRDSSFMSMSSIIFGTIGGFAGIYVGYRMSQSLN